MSLLRARVRLVDPPARTTALLQSALRAATKAFSLCFYGVLAVSWRMLVRGSSHPLPYGLMKFHFSFAAASRPNVSLPRTSTLVQVHSGPSRLR